MLPLPAGNSAGQAVPDFPRISQNFSEGPIEDGERSIQADDVLNNLQNVVVQGAALSRYFWPARAGYEKRARFLKERLGLGEDSPLKNRDLRNHIEHFDERLDDYIAQGLVGRIFPQYIGESIEGDGVPYHIFRAYYIDLDLFEILGHRYNIRPIATEILRIHTQLSSINAVVGSKIRAPDEECLLRNRAIRWV